MIFMQVMDSSEALLTGRRPPFRLIVWAAMPDGRVSSAVVPAVSENFVVSMALWPTVFDNFVVSVAL